MPNSQKSPVPLPAGSNQRATRRRRWHKFLLVFIILLALSPYLALFFSRELLCLSTGPATGESLVVLGGETIHRPGRAYQLFHDGAAPSILITGTGDCQEVHTFLVAKGVPEQQLQIECNSRNTCQNAQFSVRILREQKIKRAIIVTSWFHSRRALKTFRHFAPEIQFSSAPTVDDLPGSRWPNPYERGWVLNEYLKLGYYWVRYGISPF